MVPIQSRVMGLLYVPTSQFSFKIQLHFIDCTLICVSEARKSFWNEHTSTSFEKYVKNWNSCDVNISRDKQHIRVEKEKR